MGVDDPAGGDGRYRWRLDQVERCVRRGSLLEASTLIETAPDEANHAIEHRLDYLADHGYPTEARLLGALLANPEVRRASGWPGSLFILAVGAALFVLYRLVMGPVVWAAVLPVIVLELSAWFAVLRRRCDGTVAELRLLQDMRLVSVRWWRLTPRLVAMVGALSLLGAITLVFVGTPVAPWPVIGVVTILGLVVLATDVAFRASTRVADAGLQARQSRGEIESVLTQRRVAVRPLDRAVTFPRPRLMIQLFVMLYPLIAVVAALISGRAELVAIGLVGGAVLGLLVYRVIAHTSVTLGPDGIQEVGILRTRRYTWDDVHAVGLEGNSDEARTVSLWMIDARGRRRTLVLSGVLRAQDVEGSAIAEAADAAARAPDPGPDPRSIRLRTASLVLLVVLTPLFVLLGFVALAREPTMPIAPAQVPAGRVYWTNVFTDGSTSTYIRCPSVSSGDAEHDPLCRSAVESARGEASLAFILAALMAATAVVIAAWLRAQRVDRRRADG